ncbi:YugN family protein [Bacillus sp. FJAT-47783]|uniref:YugN family protein n=1 Tax=Bacillus sp. FJAT-47783 TaxID=2922712 RepID=UPI001FAD7049|nr:YugN family protein [Bacillus sp. FJAT-47783]
MKFTNFGIEGLKVELSTLDDALEDLGFVRAAQWDYERVTYDRKFEHKGDVFYLRIQGHAVEGDVGAHQAIIQLMTPLLGKHYYPHGVEYGEDEHFPTTIVETSEKLLKRAKEVVEKLNV